MPGATPLSELLSDPATRSVRVVGARTRARKIEVLHLRCVCTCRRQVRACVASRVRVRVCECVRQERRLACESFFPEE